MLTNIKVLWIDYSSKVVLLLFLNSMKHLSDFDFPVQQFRFRVVLQIQIKDEVNPNPNKENYPKSGEKRTKVKRHDFICTRYTRKSLNMLKARLHRRFLSRNSMQFLSRQSCIKFRTCSKLDATSARQKSPV